MNKQVSVLFFFIGVLFTTTLILSNILAVKIIQIGPWSAPAGIIVFPLTYILNDIIAEVWGFRKARLIIWVGFFMNILMVGFLSIAIHLVPASFWSEQDAFSTILGNTPRIVIASLFAYLSGSLLNAFVLSKMKAASKGKNFSFRAITSTIIGEGIDSLIFIFVAFWGVFDNSTLIKIVMVQTLLKTSYEIVILPITIIIVKKIKQIEKIDTIDTNLSFNPFKFSQL